MAEYTISQVSPKIKNWKSKYGDMTTYYIKLKEHGEEIIQLNQKSDSPMPDVGDKLYGHVEETEYGTKFKKEQKPQTAKSNYVPRDDEAIRAQWAIGQAVQAFPKDKSPTSESALYDIEKFAKELYVMVERVKGYKEPIQIPDSVNLDEIPY